MTAEKEFWKWFIDNRPALEKFMQNPQEDFSVYHALTAEMHKVNEGIYPELGFDKQNNHMLVITPDGRREGIEPVRKMAESAPEIPGWTIVKFRQPTDDASMEM